ncbi:MAG: PQQ-binding-like beta-propeller repeat protein [Candidatus Zhuqueibacterota bacterium]
MEFAWLSDTHVGATTGAADLSLAVRDINSMDQIDFVIVSGDITETGRSADLTLSKSILDSLKRPYFIIPGNHDTKWSETGATRFSELWGSDKFNFAHRGIRFIGMHQGPLMRMADGHFSPEDLRWLDSQLADLSASNGPVVFVTHYPMDSSVDNWFEFLNRLKQINIVAVLCGHGHANKAYDFEGIPGVMGRSTLRRNAGRGGYHIVRIDSDSLRFFERVTGVKTLPAWLALPMRAVRAGSDTTRPIAPDFSVNQRYPRVSEIWSFDAQFTIASTPLVTEGVVVVGNSNGTVFGLSLDHGSELWRFQTGNAIYSSPAGERGNVVFGSADHHIYCLDARTGNLVWRYKTGAPVLAAPTIASGMIYIGGSDGIFRAIQLDTGQLVWQFSGVEGFVETKALVYCDKVIFGAWDTFLYALHQKDGQLAWRWSNQSPSKLFSPAACWPVAADRKIFIVAPDRYMTAIHAETGETLWRSNRYRVRESIGISENSAECFARCMVDTVVAFSTRTETPALIWARHCGFGYDIAPNMPVEKDGTLYFGTKNGFVFALDSATGETKWAHRVGVTLINTMTPIDGQRVVLADMDGRVKMLVDNEGNQ